MYRNGTARLLLALLMTGSLPGIASAQYFGRQKVQYDHFQWRELNTSHFSTYFYPAEEQATQDAARMAERWYVRHSRLFQFEFDDRPLIFYADAPDFQQTNVISGMIGEGTGGVTEPLRTRVTMPFTGVYADNDHVLGHELVHVFQYGVAQSGPEAGGLNRMSQLPLWLVEGMAEYLSIGRNDPLTAMWMRDSALRGELPSIQQLSRDTRFFPYRYGEALLAWVGGRWGDRAVTELYVRATRVGLEQAFQEVLGASSNEISDEWATAVRNAYLPLIAGKQRPADAGEPVVVDTAAGAMNLSPAVSPDGNFVAYYGRRGLFSIDLLLADARTGKVLKKLTSPTSDSHYDALSFISTAGSWSPDGRQFVFVVYDNGDQRLDIMDIESGDITRTLHIPGIGAVQHPAWSPDGRSIAFSGMRGGISDIYILDLQDGSLRQLTNDRFGDLQPAWSPDGRTLAFISDRGLTDLQDLHYGHMQLAFADLGTGTIRTLSVFPGANHVDPHYSPDGRSLFFLSDQDGFSDIYRLDLTTRDVFRITSVATGVSGITALSPAITVAAQAGRLMFSVFENSGNNIYALDADRTTGERVVPGPAGDHPAGVLPPFEGGEGAGLIEASLDDPTTGLPDSTTFPTRKASSKFGLEYVGPPSVGVGVGAFGTGVIGSAAFYFGDMLGNKLLGVAVNAQGTLKDIGGQVVYQNAARRLNWGIGLSHIPYLTGFTTLRQGQLGDGTPVTEVDQYLERIYVNQLQLITQYPLSTTKRFELTAGVTRYGFGREIDRYLVDFAGNVLNRTRVDTTGLPALNFVQGSLAFVTDNSYFGFTSPIMGGRSRFEVTPTTGSLTFYSALADYRRYQMLGKSLTLAGRALHFGRYGPDSDGRNSQGEQVMSPLFLGDEYLIRGYSWGSFSGAECQPATGQNNCPAFDRLVGTRIAVANLELRIPLIGTDQFGLIHGGFIPTEISPFVDAGLAWSGGDDVSLRFARNTTDRVPVFSAGVSARFNIFGYLVLETYWAYPFERPDKGGTFGLQLNPGW